MKRVRIELEDEEGYIYVLPSLAFAREYLGISRDTMDAVCDRGIRVAGYLVRKSEEKETNERDLPKISGMERRRLREEVIAWREDGEAVKFPSVSVAARIAGCREVTIRQAMRREAKAGGWFWEKAEGSWREYREWCPGMPVAFKFRLNAKMEGMPERRKEVDRSVTLEQREWMKAGVDNARDWRAYLKRTLCESEFMPPLSDIEIDYWN